MPNAGYEYQFVELNRTFHSLPTNPCAGSEISKISSFRGGTQLHWSDITQEFRVVVLSEAGTGKTEEIRHVARKLRREGKEAFFLRLEHIANDFEDAFEVGSVQEFEFWLASGNEGWLLLDSVDEARLRHPGDFELAIRKLGRRIGKAMERVRILITGRPDAWRPKTDLELCIALLPYSQSSVTVADDDEGEHANRNFNTNIKLKSNELSAFKIVVLNDLDRCQIETFIAAKGIANAQSFCNAVERADAWPFTARPQDLMELTEFWKDHGKIGSRIDVLRNSIERRLKERDQTRADFILLSPTQIRQGVKLIAAAVTLTRDSNVRVPDGTYNCKGIPIRDILPDWSEKESSKLLSLPIFDEAMYGTVRFHHRSVREFLTAEWLAELLSLETSRRKIEAILFRNQYGIDVIVPTMRPILPWLAILDNKVRERISQIAPEVLLEGGDPSQLPFELRRRILRQVCEQIASGRSGTGSTDYAAVQRFANADLVGDIKEMLRKYPTNDELNSFLIRMVWLGELKDALRDAKTLALCASSSIYTRIAALRAVQAIGSVSDMEFVRLGYLNEGKELNRDLLAELLDSLEPTTESAKWLLDCLVKVSEKDRNTIDGLADGVAEFVQRARIELLPYILSSLSKLLDTSPFLDNYKPSLSKKFAWLMRAASHATERLIEAGHPHSLEGDALSILRRFDISHGSDYEDYSETTFRFTTLVPTWPELNRASFWYDAGKAIEELDPEKNQQLTEYWQVSMFAPVWRFANSDFGYALTQIAKRTLPNEKFFALSLAFRLYVDGGRNRKQRYQLKRAVSGDVSLSNKLNTYLKPPANGPQLWKRQKAKLERQAAARKREVAKLSADWQTYLSSNVELLRNISSKPGSLTDAQLYVHDRMRANGERYGRWTNGSWKCLSSEFGGDVAQAFRDGAVRFWRGCEPKVQSEGAPANETPQSVVFGLTGLEIEANETPDWASHLSLAEVENVCRYAAHELNGFPTWFPVLFATHPRSVSRFLIKEINYELAKECNDSGSNYILYDISWSGQWAWSELAPEIIFILKNKDIVNLSNLGYLLNVIQGDSIEDDEIAKLASSKCSSPNRLPLEHSAQWFAVWVGVDPDNAIPFLVQRIGQIAEPEDRLKFAMLFVANLLGSSRYGISRVRSAFCTPTHLKRLYLLVHEYVKASEDVNRLHKGVYTPGVRDEAQDGRERLAELLRNIPGKNAFVALVEIGKVHPEESYRAWFAKHARAKAELDADLSLWSPHQVRDFHNKLERTPDNHRDLADLANFRLMDLKDDLENGDSSIAKILQGVTLETDIRKYIGKELREKAFGRYIIPQEEELADAKRPDLRFHGTSFDGPVPCELKLADNWTGPLLFERLENQLCGDYLRDNRSHCGLFLLVYRGKKQSWIIPGGTDSVNFDGLVDALNIRWQTIALNYPGVEKIEVIGIDLTKRSIQSSKLT